MEQFCIHSGIAKLINALPICFARFFIKQPQCQGVSGNELRSQINTFASSVGQNDLWDKIAQIEGSDVWSLLR
tara:strand:+ start:9143 stop:9361 length:219 start_codon:yes stop_codon:yes gene_type:complete